MSARRDRLCARRDGLFAEQHIVIGCALAFAAGVFLCIALADLLPEVAFHAHDRFRLTLALFLGIALAWASAFLSPSTLTSRTRATRTSSLKRRRQSPADQPSLRDSYSSLRDDLPPFAHLTGP